MKYRVLKVQRGSTATEVTAPVMDRDKARTEAQAWVQEQSGRTAIVIAERDTYTSSVTVKHTPGTED